MSKLTATTAMLMSPDEKALFRGSESRLLYKVGDAELRTRTERARHLRKKYDGLLQRERASAQRAGEEPGSRAANGNPNTLRKATAFAYVVSQYEAESDRRAGTIVPAKGSPDSAKTARPAQAKASAKKPASRAKSAPAAPARGSKAGSAAAAKSGASKAAPRSLATTARGGAPSSAPRAKSSELRHQRGPARRPSDHAAARGRRQQARSDSRG